jgi:hypothetical protein
MSKKTEYFLNPIGVKGIVANGSIGTPGQALISNGTSTYWGSVSGTGAGSLTFIGPVAPASSISTEGDTWWDSETAARYVYYNDGDNIQWVQDTFAGPNGPIGYTGSAGLGVTKQTGFTAMTGTATKTAIDTSTATTTQIAQRLKAIDDALRALGLID